MIKISFFFFIVALFISINGCSKNDRNSDKAETTQTAIKHSQTKKRTIERFIHRHFVFDSYFPSFLGKMDTLNAPSFIYKQRHRFVLEKETNSTIDTLDLFFLFNNQDSINGYINYIDYTKYFDSSGVSYRSFSNFKFEEWSILNTEIDMFKYQGEEKSSILIIGSFTDQLLLKKGMSIHLFFSRNFGSKLEDSTLYEGVDKISVCSDFIEEECKELIFKNKILQDIILK